ncbi:hypothetical protein PISMIDRAFT_275088 [Pisolithus microcarpus 441]|uniref:Uncharacterized protein n=1 Tax=Pisolithus microcarpus 441 TaxID=765257 RepID=A0A0C9ZAY7_9AGAM|nr:hypothetical protein PISMIDRAFT_275088 [Pisolithus microcarpus 441]
MARTQSKKRRLLGLVKSSNSMSGLATSPGRSQVRAGNFASTSETTGVASQGMLTRMRRLFRRSKQGPSPTVLTGISTVTAADMGAQERRDQPRADLTLEAADTNTGGGADQQRVLSETVPTQEATDQVEPESTLVSAGKVVGAAVEELEHLDPISRLGAGAVTLVGRADTAFIGIENLSDRYLKPFRTFNQVVTTLAHVSTSAFSLM